MRVVFMEELLALGVTGVLSEVRRIVGDQPTYVSFDIDSVDPAFAPGTGTPEVGGLSTREAQSLLRGLAGLNIVGADVVEVAPAYDPSGVTALAGATMMFELLCVLAGARQGAPRAPAESSNSTATPSPSSRWPNPTGAAGHSGEAAPPAPPPP